MKQITKHGGSSRSSRLFQAIASISSCPVSERSACSPVTGDHDATDGRVHLAARARFRIGEASGEGLGLKRLAEGLKGWKGLWPSGLEGIRTWHSIQKQVLEASVGSRCWKQVLEAGAGSRCWR